MKLPEKWQKVVEQNGDTLKVLGENEKWTFNFYFKTKRTLWPMRYKIDFLLFCYVLGMLLLLLSRFSRLRLCVTP